MTTLHVPRITAYITLGSNIEPEKNLSQAVQLLKQHSDVKALSSVYQTKPQGFLDQPDFLNMAVCLMTPFPIEDFKSAVLDTIEQKLGRKRDPQNPNAPRTIDLDIALWGDKVMDYGAKPWHVPDRDIQRFAHLALPLAEIAPQVIHPEFGQSLAELAAIFQGEGYTIRGDIRLI